MHFQLTISCLNHNCWYVTINYYSYSTIEITSITAVKGFFSANQRCTMDSSKMGSIATLSADKVFIWNLNRYLVTSAPFKSLSYSTNELLRHWRHPYMLQAQIEWPLLPYLETYPSSQLYPVEWTLAAAVVAAALAAAVVDQWVLAVQAHIRQGKVLEYLVQLAEVPSWLAC